VQAAFASAAPAFRRADGLPRRAAPGSHPLRDEADAEQRKEERDDRRGKYGERVIEPEIKLRFAALFLMMFVAERGDGHAVLPAFLFGLAMARTLAANRTQQRRLRVVSFALLTPFFFLKSGMNVSIPAVIANVGWLLALFAVKMSTKLVGVYPLARLYAPTDSWYTTLLMSTGLTFGTISSLYGLNAGIIDQAQFSVLVTTVIATAVIPTIIAQRFFSPRIRE